MSVNIDMAIQICQLKGTIKKLQQYIETLEKQNKTKAQQNLTLHEQLQLIQKEIQCKAQTTLSTRSYSYTSLNSQSNSRNKLYNKIINTQQDCLIPKYYLEKLQNDNQFKARQIQQQYQLNMEILSFIMRLEKQMDYFMTSIGNFVQQNKKLKQLINSKNNSKYLQIHSVKLLSTIGIQTQYKTYQEKYTEKISQNKIVNKYLRKYNQEKYEKNKNLEFYLKPQILSLNSETRHKKLI